MITQTDLSQFSGTENYYKHMFKQFVYTDGVKYLAENAANGNGAYWLIDAIASHVMTNSKLKQIPFQIWTLTVNKDNNTAILTCKEDTNSPILVKQAIEYTDVELDEVKLYLIDGVLLLTSEY